MRRTQKHKTGFLHGEHRNTERMLACKTKEHREDDYTQTTEIERMLTLDYVNWSYSTRGKI
jgi:hypothetical protein